MSLRLTEGFCNSAVSLTSSTIRCDETWTRMTKVSHNRLHCQRLFIALGSRESVFVFIKKSVRQIKLTNDDQWPDQTHLVQLLGKVSKTEQVARILQTVDSRQYLDRESLKTWLFDGEVQPLQLSHTTSGPLRRHIEILIKQMQPVQWPCCSSQLYFISKSNKAGRIQVWKIPIQVQAS